MSLQCLFSLSTTIDNRSMAQNSPSLRFDFGRIIQINHPGSRLAIRWPSGWFDFVFHDVLVEPPRILIQTRSMPCSASHTYNVRTLYHQRLRGKLTAW